MGSDAQPEIAIECVGAVNQQRTETWNVGPAKGSFPVPVGGDWHVILQPGAVVKQVRSAIPELLMECQSAGLQGFTRVDAFLRVSDPALYERLAKLKIDSVGHYEGPNPGTMHLGMTGFGGAVDRFGRQVSNWVGEFLRANERYDVLLKLRASGATQCHVFIIVSFGGVPWLVESYLGTHTDAVPQEKPDLPKPVDSVWIMYGARGVRWDGHEWRFFNAVVPAASES